MAHVTVTWLARVGVKRYQYPGLTALPPPAEVTTRRVVTAKKPPPARPGGRPRHSSQRRCWWKSALDARCAERHVVEGERHRDGRVIAGQGNHIRDANVAECF